MLPVKPHTVDYLEKLKLPACELRPGMYVCELDRPWLETPFLLQGFEISDDTDIDAVMQYCEYVYIDVRRSRVVGIGATPKLCCSKLNRHNASFGRQDLETSAATRKHTTKLLMDFADEIRFGQSPKLHLAKAVVSDCVAGVMGNPAAMMFMTKLRRKDEYTSQHAFSVCVYSIILGRLLGFDAAQMENVGTCGLLHDVGKLEIPDAILNKAGELTDEEKAIMRSHAQRGRDILMSGRTIVSGAVDVAYGHHEHLDGTGYPRGLLEHQLTINCKIVSVADKYDALTTHRSYRPGQDHLSAVSILNVLAQDNKIDAKISSSFVSYLGIYPPGCIVELSGGEVGIVISSNTEHRLRPQVLLVRDARKNPIQCFVDLREKTVDTKGRPYRIVAVHRAGDFAIDVSQYYDVIVQAFG